MIWDVTTAPRYPDAVFIEAANYTKTPGSNGSVTRIVIHDMESNETAQTAEACAAMFHGANSPQASAHFCVDSDSVVQCVDLDRRAWHAPPNTGSVGIEHAGLARQTAIEWMDTYGRAMLDVSAKLTAWLCGQLAVPIVKLSSADLLAGERGLCGHADVSAAWHQTDHTDPGTAFPWTYYLSRVQAFASGTPGAPTTPGTPGEEDMPLTDADVTKVATAAMRAVWNYIIPGQPDTTAILLKHSYDQSALNTVLLQKPPTPVDVAALAAAIAALLPSTVTAIEAALLATSVCDEIHARMAS